MTDLTLLSRQTQVQSAARTAVATGLQVLLLPADGTKVPLNLRGAGHAGGAHAATGDPAELEAWLRVCVSRGLAVNLGVKAGAPLPDGHRLAVVDLDTTGAREAFSAMWSQNDAAPAPNLTVHSPGAVSSDGTRWVHWDGGHIYLAVPADLAEGLPATVHLTAGETPADAVDVQLRDRFVMAPPSVRREGHYRWGETPRIVDAPDWLVELLRSSAPPPKPEREDLGAWTVSDAREDWEAVHGFGEFLLADGWTPFETDSTCGCPTWTRPGGADHGKSATAHDEACSPHTGNSHAGWLHIWSDLASGEIAEAGREVGRALNLVEVAAAVRYAEDLGTSLNDKVRQFLREEGLGRSGGVGFSDELDLAAAVTRVYSPPEGAAPVPDPAGGPRFTGFGPGALR